MIFTLLRPSCRIHAMVIDLYIYWAMFRPWKMSQNDLVQVLVSLFYCWYILLVKPTSMLDNFVAADQTLQQTKLMHKSNLLLAGLAPLAVLGSNTMLQVPLDLALGAVLVAHTHMGMNYIFTDYLKQFNPSGGFRMGFLAVTALASLGLLRLTFSEKGIVGSVLATWSSSKAEKSKEIA